jgi:hypothetical protein
LNITLNNLTGGVWGSVRVGVHNDKRRGSAPGLLKQPKAVIRVMIGKKNGDFSRRGGVLRSGGAKAQKKENENQFSAGVKTPWHAAGAATRMLSRKDRAHYAQGIEAEIPQAPARG